MVIVINISYCAIFSGELNTLKGHANHVNSVAISSDGSLVVSGSEDNRVRLWNRFTGVEILDFNLISFLWGCCALHSFAFGTPMLQFDLLTLPF